MKKSFAFALSCFMFLSINGQINLPKFNGPEEFNFVPNPSFEESKKTPCYWNQGKKELDKWFTDWTSPTATTPDLLSTRGKSNCWSHPAKHNDGKQFPHSGSNMMGIKIFGLGGTETYWHEYLQITLLEDLKKDSLYYVSVWVNLSKRASKASNNIGIALVEEKLENKNRLPLYITPVVNSEKIIHPKILGWKKIKGVFKATGKEKHLVIGNFYGDDETLTEKIPGGTDGAYYYIDDVKLRKARPNERETRKPKKSIGPPPPAIVEGRITSEEVKIDKVEYETGSTVELKNIFFDFDKAELLPQSTEELERLRDLLLDYPYMEIKITGHTDNVGANDYNVNLSLKRAKAVFEYLIENDIEESRLSFEGLGSEKPLADNSTDEGKEKNRRVEFEVIKK